MPPELLNLLPLSLAAGVDLYFTLLFLGMAGRLGWELPAPGELSDLAVPGVIAVAAFFWTVELWIERQPVRSLFWNAAHTVVRPLAGVLLAWMALADLPPASRVAGALAAGALTLAAHTVRSGWGLLLALLPTPPRVRLLVSIAEDVGTLALLSLLLDVPRAGVVLGALILLAGLAWGRSAAGAFTFALRVVIDAARGLLHGPRWLGPERFPRWIRRALANPALAPGGALRGSPAAAHDFPGLGLFCPGWVVVRGGSPLFVCKGRMRARVLDLGSGTALAVRSGPLHTQVVMAGGEGRHAVLYFGAGGPDPGDLRAEFQL